MNNLDKIKVEDKVHDVEITDKEEINSTSVIKALLILVSVVIVGLLLLFGLEKYNTYNANKQIHSYLRQVNSELDKGTPLSSFLVENMEFDLTRLRDENIENKLNIEEINSTLHRILDFPVYVRVGTQYRSWATSEIVSTELDSVVVPFKDRVKYTIRTVYKPTNTTESKAFDLQKSHPDWTKDDCLRIVNKKIWAGMSKVQLQISWGQPKAVDKNYSFGSNSEQWVYGSMGPYVYIENGIVTSWQE